RGRNNGSAKQRAGQCAKASKKLQNHEVNSSIDMDFSDVKLWRKTERARLIAARVAVPAAEIEAWRLRIDASLERSFPGLAKRRLAFCWPIKNEYDARYVARTLRERGAVTALPVVVAPKQPLAFREWHPGVALV